MIRVNGLTKTFEGDRGEVHALRRVTFETQEGEFYTLLGPSGCGKTTTLRCIAGLEKPDFGEISIGDNVMASGAFFVPPERRPIGMVFQSYAIWPHMTVFENVAFPVVNERLSRREIRERVSEALSLVRLEELAGRHAPYLSGGQQQRVALARALVAKPQVLLLDEPLSNLDVKLREEMRLEIKRLTSRLGITTLYVTHDQTEAVALSDRIAIMKEGVIVEEGEPWKLYHEPSSVYTATFIGNMNFLDGKVVRKSLDGCLIRVGEATVKCISGAALGEGEKVTIGFRPEILEVYTAPEPQGENDILLSGHVVEQEFLGDLIRGHVRISNGAIITIKMLPRYMVRPGERVHLRIPLEFVSFWPGSNSVA